MTVIVYICHQTDSSGKPALMSHIESNSNFPPHVYLENAKSSVCVEGQHHYNIFECLNHENMSSLRRCHGLNTVSLTWAGANQTFFWYDNDKDLPTCFLHDTALQKSPSQEGL